MNISKELQTLVDAALEDGKLSDKEKQILYKRAEKDGLDLDEFELFLSSLLYKAKGTLHRGDNKLFLFSKWLVEKKRRVLLLIIFLLTTVGLLVNYFDEFSDKKKQENMGCVNVLDCLSKYKFEEAREYYSRLGKFDINRNQAIRDIISSEVSYYLTNDSKEFAFASINEYALSWSPKFQGERDDNDAYNEEITWYNQEIEKLIIYFEEDTVMIRKIVNLIKPTFKFKKLISKYKDANGNECCSHLDQVEFFEDNDKKNSLMKKHNV